MFFSGAAWEGAVVLLLMNWWPWPCFGNKRLEGWDGTVDKSREVFSTELKLKFKLETSMMRAAAGLGGGLHINETERS